MPTQGDQLDGYTLIRKIGEGGFGEVWLCRSDAIGDYRALKFIAASNGSALDKEYEALVRYRRAAAKLRSHHLTSIEHVNRCEGGLFYIMPLADGDGADSPEHADWHPRTLRTVIEVRRRELTWFSTDEVIALIAPLLEGLQTLADAGLVHRDIKPDNILFFGGKPCLGDISLMTNDRTQVTRHGTPGYSAPSWYTGGHLDMYGAAATLYTLLTGNEPDRMGRSGFNKPPQGNETLPEPERVERTRLFAVVRRATEESVSERYPDFGSMKVACTKGIATADIFEKETVAPQVRRGTRRAWLIPGFAASLLTGLFVWKPWNMQRQSAGETGGNGVSDGFRRMQNLVQEKLTENDRVAREYEKNLGTLREFYESKAPPVLKAMEDLASATVSVEEFERRQTVIADGLAGLVRPQLDMREDPLVPLPHDEYIRRIKAAREVLKKNPVEPLRTLTDTQVAAKYRLLDIYEAAEKIPQNAEEQFWFDKQVSLRFYGSPKRPGGMDILPMDTLWGVAAKKGGVIHPLAEGRQVDLITALGKNALRLAKESEWPDEASRRIVDNLKKMKNSALWVRIQVAAYALPQAGKAGE